MVMDGNRVYDDKIYEKLIYCNYPQNREPYK